MSSTLTKVDNNSLEAEMIRNIRSLIKKKAMYTKLVTRFYSIRIGECPTVDIYVDCVRALEKVSQDLELVYGTYMENYLT